MTRETRTRERGRVEKKSAHTTGFRGRGRAGLDRIDTEMQEIQDRRNKPFAPWRYRAGWEKGDDYNPVIFLDASLEDAFFMHEHGVQDAKGNFGREFEPCVKETDNCPLCAQAAGGAKNVAHSAYVMFLTVLDLRPYKNKDGVKVKHSKKLFAVRGGQVQDWVRILEKAEKKFKTLRGVYMEIGRSGKKEAGTGKPLPLEVDWYGDDADDRPYAIVDEKDLEAEYGHDARMSDDGKRVLAEADADIRPYIYEEIFPEPDVDALARKYGVKSRSAGSQADIEDEFNGDADRPRRGRARRTPVDDEGEEETPRRRRNRVTEDEDEDETPVKPRRGRRAEPEDEDEVIEAEDDGDDEDTPKPPPRTRKEAEQEEDEKPSRRSRRAAPAEDEEDEAEEAPARGRTRSRAKAEPEDAEDEKPSGRTRARKTEEADEEEDEAPRRRTSGRAKAAEKTRSSRKVAAAADDEDEPF